MKYTRLAGAVLLALCVGTFEARAASADWKADWDKTVAAAKKEGALTISGPSGSVWRSALMTFEKAYPGIKVKITAFSGRDFWPRFLKEREIGQYLWDLRIGGYDTQAYRARLSGQLAPVRDVLVLPEILDDSKWYGGLDGAFLDKDKRYVFSFVAVEQTSARYNTNFVKDPGMNVSKLVDPEWRGKISMADPRGGSSLTSMGGLYRLYGPDFIKKLVVDQKPVITNVPRQQLEWLTSGRYPIAFGLPSAALVEYARSGGDTKPLVQLPGILQWSAGVGAIAMPTKAPHPAAAKVFINWLLTKDTQTSMMKIVDLNSRRKDVPLVNTELALDYSKLDQYYGGQTEEMKSYIQEASKLVRKILKR